MGISKETLSDNPYNQSMDTLHNIIEYMLQGVPISTSNQFPGNDISEYWPRILVFISTMSLPASSKFLENSIVPPAILQDPLPIQDLTSHLQQDLKTYPSSNTIGREIQYY